MTKKDLKVIVIGSVAGLGGLAAIVYFLRKTQTVPVVNPAIIKWEPQ